MVSPVGARPTTILVTALVIIDAFLSILVTPISADTSGTGTITFTVANHPPSIANVTINQTGNNVTLVAIVLQNPDTLVDVDRVVVFFYQPGTNVSLSSYNTGALGFEWTRKGSRSSPDKCFDSTGCWYEQTSTGWNRSLDDVAAFSHDAINAKTTVGAWNFSFTISGCVSSSWGYVVTVYDRADLTATAAGSFTVTCP